MTCANLFFGKKADKKCIYTMYIYRKRHVFAISGQVSYGYPMGIVWVSYGRSSIGARYLGYSGGMLEIFYDNKQDLPPSYLVILE